MTRMLLTLAAAGVVFLSTPVLQAQQGPPPADAPPTEEPPSPSADLATFRGWLNDYQAGTVRMMSDLQPDPEALADAERRMKALAAWSNLTVARLLFEAACVDPAPPGSRSASDNLDFQAELMPWRIRAMARAELVAMQVEGLDEWLLGHVDGKLLARAKDDDEAPARRADAALRVLGPRGGGPATEALRRALGAFPKDLRLAAVDVLAENADLDSAEVFLDLIRDRQPEIRIVAVRGIANALSPFTDESDGDPELPPRAAELRDEALSAFARIIERDNVWQVRAAAASSLAQLRTRLVIPILIDGYEAELKKKKDPWAMDVRLNKLLAGLTGQEIVLGDARPWKRFWKENSETFRFASAEKARESEARKDDGKYGKFFSIDLQSDRVLFVVDFSGSMKEEITLASGTTTTKAGETTSKVRLVLDELRRIVLSLPEESYFNVIAFSDGVRTWRARRGGAPELVRLDDDARDDLLGSFLQSLEPRGPTNLHGALDRAIGFAGQGLNDKYYDVGFDTIYILSDGAPSYGAVTDKDEIRRLVREANHLKRLTIHAITFGAKNDTDFLRKLAEENGGRHVHVE